MTEHDKHMEKKGYYKSTDHLCKTVAK